MPNDLSEIRERIETARAESSALTEMTQTFNLLGLAVVEKPTPGRDTLDLYVTQTRPIPTAIKSKSGMIANELRSCLDGLACTLAIRNGKNTAGTYFPISKSKAIFEDDGMRKIKKLSDVDKAKIVGLQPYRGGNALLFGLHEADRTRKHIRLTGLGVANTRATFGGAFAFGPTGSGVLEQCRINGFLVEHLECFGSRQTANVGAEVIIASGVPRYLPFHLSLEIAYGEPLELENKPLIPTLAEFADVVQQIVEGFA